MSNEKRIVVQRKLADGYKGKHASQQLFKDWSKWNAYKTKEAAEDAIALLMDKHEFLQFRLEPEAKTPPRSARQRPAKADSAAR